MAVVEGVAVVVVEGVDAAGGRRYINNELHALSLSIGGTELS